MAGQQHSSWPAGGGTMGALIRANDWSATPLGAVETWPYSLKTAIEIMLASGFPATVQYGRQALLIYNDAYIPVIGDKHPSVLGRSSYESFSEIRPHLEAVFARVFAGETVILQDQHFAILQHGTPKDVWFTLSHIPVRDEGGEVIAVLVQGVDTGARILAERQRDEVEASLRESEERQRFLVELGDVLRPLAAAVEIQGAAARLLGDWLGTTRAYYVEYDAKERCATVARDYVADDSPSLVGRYGYEQYRTVLERVADGRTSIVPDVAADAELAKEAREILVAQGVVSWIDVPLVKQGTLVAILCVVQGEARKWTDAEVELVEETAERTWAAVERARAEEALRESEARFRHIVESARDYAIFTMDAEGVVVNWYKGAEAVFGYKAEEIVGRDGAVLFVPEDRATGEVDKEFETARREGSAPNIRWHLCKGGDRVFIEGRTIALQANGDRLGGFLKIGQDVTERRQMESMLRQREAELTRVQQIGGVGGVDVDLAGPYRGRRSPEYLSLHGLSEDAADETHQDWLARVYPADREQADRNLQDVLGGGGSAYRGEYRIIRPSDGEVRWIEARADIERDAAGRPLRLIGAHIDVTERKRIEEARVRTESRLRALMEGIPQLVWRAEDAGQWTWSSPQWQDYTGQSEEASRRFGWLDALHPDDRDQASKAWAKAQRSGRLEVEYRVHHAAEGRYRWFQTRATPVRDIFLGNIVEWLGTSTDVDELLQLQEKQNVLVAELQHRTRNLIAVVRSTAGQTLASATWLGEFSSAFNDRLAALSRVQGFLSRPEEEPLSIGALVRLELDALGGEVDTGRITLEGPEVPLRAASVQILALALHELATNARKYGALADGDGRLDIGWHVGEADGDGPRLVLDWVETASVTQDGADIRRGYGRELIERALPYTLGAATSFEVTAQGVRCRIDIPLAGRAARAG